MPDNDEHTDLLQRAKQVQSRASEVRREAVAARAARGSGGRGRAIPGDESACARAHHGLQDALAILDGAIRGPDHREMRARMIDHGTLACAHARLGQEAEMRAELAAMLTDALALPVEGPEQRDVVRLRRAIRMALADPEEGSGH